MGVVEFHQEVVFNQTVLVTAIVVAWAVEVVTGAGVVGTSRHSNGNSNGSSNGCSGQGQPRLHSL